MKIYKCEMKRHIMWPAYTQKAEHWMAFFLWTFVSRLFWYKRLHFIYFQTKMYCIAWSVFSVVYGLWTTLLICNFLICQPRSWIRTQFPSSLQEVFRSHPGVLWFDASIRFQSNDVEQFRSKLVRNGGAVLLSVAGHSNFVVTHPLMYR